MTDRRSPRIHVALTIWTLLVIGLVLVEIRRLPPGLTALLVPYLAVMASLWIDRLRQQHHGEPVVLLDDTEESSAQGPSEETPDFPESGGYSGHDDAPMTTSPRRDDEQVTPPSRRVRARRRPRAPEPEPIATSWVQVWPGRFVRAVEMSPDQTADDSNSDSQKDEPPGAAAPDNPCATSDRPSTHADADTVVAEPEPSVNQAEKDGAETVVPEDREIADEATSGALATATFLVGCPPGDPGDQDRSLSTSGAGAEIEPDDRREDMPRTEMPGMDLG